MRGFSKRPRAEHLNTENLCELEGLHCKVTEKTRWWTAVFQLQKKKKSLLACDTSFDNRRLLHLCDFYITKINILHALRN